MVEPATDRIVAAVRGSWETARLAGWHRRSDSTDYTYDGITLFSLDASRSDETTYAVAYLTGEDGCPYAGVYTASAASPVTFLIATTDRGDVVALTDTAGDVFARYTYDPYGTVLSQDSNAVTGITPDVAAAIAARQPLRYAGYAYDAHSATYYLSARHYDPATMRFLTKDPARDDGEESAYQYCGGDPVGKADPTGLFFHIVRSGSWWWYETHWYRWWTQRGWSKTYAEPYVDVEGRYPWFRRDMYRRHGREYKYLIAQESHRYNSTGRTFKIVTYVVAAYYRTLSQDKNVWYTAKRPNRVVAPQSWAYMRTVSQLPRHTSRWIYFGTRLPQGSAYASRVRVRYL